MPDIKDELKLMDEAIRAGNGAEARHRLKTIDRKRIPRELAANVASLARRVNLPLLAIKVLNPIVRPSAKRPTHPVAEERVEYGASLIKIGAGEEGLRILQTVPPEEDSRVLLYQSFAYIARWEYSLSIPLLEKYVAVNDLSDYQKIVGEANLASALVFERKHGAAEKLLNRLIGKTRKGNHQLLMGVTLELLANHHINLKEWKAAEDALHQADKLLKHSETVQAFFVRKWRSILNYLKDSKNPAAIRSLARIRQEGMERQHWETVRLCDMYQMIQTEDEKLYNHLFFGTPYPSFRKWMDHDLHKPIDVSRSYSWELGEGPATATLDVLSGTLNTNSSKLKPGKLLHRLLIHLASDFYRPFRLAALHYRLYPEEYFNPNTSPPRVYDAVKRLREWAEESDFPLVIGEADGSYYLSSEKAVAIHVQKHQEKESPLKLTLTMLKQQLTENVFRVSDVHRILDISERSARRLLSEAEQAGLILRLGRGPSTRYRFVSKKKQAA